METRGDFLTKLRLGKGWKKRPALVAALKAAGVEVSAEMIRQYETDKARPSPDVRAGLAKVFGVSEQAIEFGREQPRTATVEPANAREEILLILYRGLFPLQQAKLIQNLRAAFDSNNVTRKHLGNKPLVGVSDERVAKAFGSVYEIEKRKKRSKPPERNMGDALGDFLDE